MKKIVAAMLAVGAMAAHGMAARADPVTLQPLIDLRSRYEEVQQAGIAKDAQAVTTRLIMGVQASDGPVTLIAEGIGLLGIDNHYNSSTNGNTQYPLVTDPQNIAIHRLAIQYRGLPRTVVTVGRQYLILDDERFIGASPWRQNEQVYDAARVQSEPIGGLKLDLSYMWSDRTIYGIDGTGTRPSAVPGENFLLHAAYATPVGTLTGFAYLIDQDQPLIYTKSSQTYGGRFADSHAFARKVRLDYALSYARQDNWKHNPNNYRANYYLADATLALNGPELGAGYEVLGADKGVAVTSFQTPLASLNRFQGWADQFLTTPPNGIRDTYGSAGYRWKKAGPFENLFAQAVYHRFDSDRLAQHYGQEWDLSLTGKIGRLALLARYASYSAEGFSVNVRKFWLSVDWSFGRAVTK